LEKKKIIITYNIFTVLEFEVYGRKSIYNVKWTHSLLG